MPIATAAAASEPALAPKRSYVMKRFVARCPATGIPVVVAVSDFVVIPVDGADISIPCPCCRTVHVMRMRDARHLREAS